jgi:glycosyltransferase involved in cell wall biosynthesis
LERNLIRYATWMTEIGHVAEINCVKRSPLEEAASNMDLDVRLVSRQHRHLPFAAASRLKRHLQSTQTDILWVRDPRDLPLCSLAIRDSGADLLFHQGMQIPQPKTKPWHRLRFKRVSRWIAPLEHLRDEALENTHLTPDQIEVIPLALETNWHSTTKSPEARVLWNLPVDAKIVGLFGRIDPLKGHDTLIRALAKTDPAWHALIIGENTPNAGHDYRSECAALAESLGVTDRVHWRPPSEALLSAYDACDAYAMCSVSETIGMVTIEALARQVPVVGTNAGGTPELLGHGTQGTLFEPGDAHALAQALHSIDALPIANEAHAQRFTKERAVKQWSETLEAIRASAS